MEVSKWLKNERNKRGYTQEQLANEIGVTKESIGNWENSRHLPEQISIDKIIELFDLKNQYKYFANEILEITGNINEQQNVDRNDNIIEQKKVPESSYDQVTCSRYVHDSLTVISVILLILGVLKLWDKHWIVGATSSILSIALFFFGHKMEKYIVFDLNRSRMVCLMAFVYLLEFLQFVCRLKGITESELFFSIVILACMLAVLALVAFEVLKVFRGNSTCS